jgi:hypothetical protein
VQPASYPLHHGGYTVGAPAKAGLAQLFHPTPAPSTWSYLPTQGPYALPVDATPYRQTGGGYGLGLPARSQPPATYQPFSPSPYYGAPAYGGPLTSPYAAVAPSYGLAAGSYPPFHTRPY